MCCTIEPNTMLANTTIVAARVLKPDGETVHSLLYQNSVRDSVPGPNAMLLPIPTSSVIGPENMVDTRQIRWIGQSYRDAVQALKPKLRSRSAGDMFKGSMMLGAAAASHRVFEVGSYTVASARSAAGLAMAIREVPIEIRPVLPARFLVALGMVYPGWSFIACCFAGHLVEGRDLDPVSLWYRPMPGREDKLFAPAVDAHDGNPPDLSASVSRDHCLAFGTHDGPDRRELGRLALDVGRLPEGVRWMFPKSVIGAEVTRTATANGDFVVRTEQTMDQEEGWLDAHDVPVEVPSRAA